MNRLLNYFFISMLCFLAACSQKQALSTFSSLGKIQDGAISISYAGSSGTTALVNNVLRVKPTTLSTTNSSITNCQIKSGTTTLPAGFSINPLTCEIVGSSASPVALTTYTIEASTNKGTTAIALVDLRIRGLYTFSGTVSGLGAGQSVSISHGTGISVVITANGGYTLDSLYDGDSYVMVTTANDLSAFTCSASNNSGVINSNIINNISCFGSGSRTLSFQISGLGAGASAVLTTNGQSVNATANGIFTFTPMALNAVYSVSLSSVTTGYSCTLANNSGTLSSNITNVTVSCGLLGPYPINVNISGIATGTIGLSNGTDTLTNKNNGSYTFAVQANYGTAYNILITQTPAFHTCHVISGTGTLTAAIDVAITCTPNSYSLGGFFQGVDVGESVVISTNSLNGIVTQTLNGVTSGVSTGFTFTSSLLFNQTYNVSLVSQPASKVCTITNTQGQITGNVANVSVVCVARAVNDCSMGSIKMWTAVGTHAVNSIACDGAYLYVGGLFTSVGPSSRYAAMFSRTDTPVADQRMPDINGAVTGVISDDNGGWYLFGSFTTIGTNLRNYLAHLNSDLSLDANFNASLTTLPLSIKLIGNDLYIAATTSNCLKKVNRYTGASDASFTTVVCNGSGVNTLESDGSNIYLGGIYTTINGIAHSNLARVNLITGALDASYGISVTGSIQKILLYNNQIYLAGAITAVNGTSVNNFARISMNGVFDATFAPTFNSFVYDLAIFNNMLFVGGLFTVVNGSAQRSFSVFDLTTGAVTAATGLSITGSGNIKKIIIDSANKLLYLINDAASNISTGQTRSGLIVYDLNPVSYSLKSQSISANAFPAAIATNGSSVFLGGSFDTIQAQSANYLTRFNLTDGNYDPTFNLNLNGIVNYLLFDAGSLYIAGGFSQVGGVTHNRVAKITVATLANDGSFLANFDGAVTKIVKYGSSIYAMGAFLNVSGTAQKYVGKIDATTGLVDVTFVNLDPSATLVDIDANAYGLFTAGSNLSFNAGAVTGQYLTNFDLTGIYNSIFFPIQPNAAVSKLYSINNNLISVGSFTNYNSVSGLSYWMSYFMDTSGINTGFGSSSYNTISCKTNSTIYIYDIYRILYSLAPLTSIKTSITTALPASVNIYNIFCTANNVFGVESTGYIRQLK